jgi:hypothetical protein
MGGRGWGRCGAGLRPSLRCVPGFPRPGGRHDARSGRALTRPARNFHLPGPRTPGCGGVRIIPRGICLYCPDAGVGGKRSGFSCDGASSRGFAAFELRGGTGGIRGAGLRRGDFFRGQKFIFERSADRDAIVVIASGLRLGVWCAVELAPEHWDCIPVCASTGAFDW